MGDKQTVSMQLPIAPMQWWTVPQGNNGSVSHTGVNTYAYDFAVAEADSKEAPVYAPARGKIVEVVDNTSGPNGGNYIKIELAPTERVVPIHIQQGSATACGVKVGDIVEMGQQIATVGDVGTGVGNYHLHIALSNEPLAGGGYQTIPSEFMYYDASTDQGRSSTFVRSGTPQEGQWIRRRSLWQPWRRLGGQLVGAPAIVSPMPNFVDIYARGADNRLWQRFWDGTSWSEWFAHDDTFELDSSPAVYSNGPEHRDVYVRGKDGGVYHKWWDGNARVWNGWYALGGQIIGEPAVVAPGGSSLVDVYARGTDDRMLQNYWDGSNWSGWFAHEGGFLLGSPLAVYSSGPNHRDVYARGQDGKVYQKWWDGDARIWNGWFGIGGAQITGAPAVISRKAGWVDVFARGADNRLWQTWWDGQSWAAWESHEDGFPLHSSLGVNSRGPEHVDLYALGEDNNIWQKWWQG